MKHTITLTGTGNIHTGIGNRTLYPGDTCEGYFSRGHFWVSLAQGVALRHYIENYQQQRMRPLSEAPPLIKLAAGHNILETRPRTFNIAQHGYYLPKQK